jgi:hypothetical protein
MSYSRSTWSNGLGGATPLNATNLNHIETGVQDASDRLDTVVSGLTAVTHNTQTGTTYTLVLADAGKIVEMNNASANTLTVPPNSSVAFPVGSFLSVRQYGAGGTTVAPGSGVTINSYGGGLRLGGQYAEATLTKRATDEWILSGETAV